MSENLRRQLSSPTALFVFEAVARLGGFRAAAQELNVTQPSVSYQIKNLERHLGTRLFQRRGRSIALSDDGKTLYRAVDRGFAVIQAGFTELSHRASGNLVTFCLSSSAAANFVLPRYPALRQDLPGLDLSIKIISRDLNPASEGADFAIRLGHGQWDDLDAWPMFEEVYFPVCAPGYFSDVHGPVTLQHVRSSDLLFLKERQRPRDDWRVFFERIGAPLTLAHERIIFDDQQALIASAVAGQGVALGWFGMVDNLVATGALVRPVTDVVRTGRGFYLVAPKGVRPSRMASAFRDWFLRESAAIQARGLLPG